MPRHAAISPSRASDFRQCPLKFRFRVVDKLPEPPSTAALRGTIVHSVLENLFELPPHERQEDAAQNLLTPAWSAHVEKNPADRQLFDSAQDEANWLESARPLIGNYFKMENPQFLEPTARESFVNAVLPSGLAIRGIIDRVDKTPNGQLRVVDYKTGKSPQPRFQDSALFQMRFYATALYYERHTLPARTQLIYLKDGRTLTYDPVEQDIASTSMEIDSVWSGIRDRLHEENFEPKTGALCNWCHFKDICPAFGGTAPAMSAEGATELLTAEGHTPTRS